MKKVRKHICVLAATPLTIHFFLQPHFKALAQNYDLTLMANLKLDTYLPPLSLPARIIDIPIARKISPIQDLVCLFKLISLFQKNQYDLLITVVPKAGLIGMLAAAFIKIPRRLHIFQGEVWANLSGLLRNVLKFCDWITASLATSILAVSSSERNFLITENVVSSNKIEVLGAGSIGGVDFDRFTPSLNKREDIRASLGIPVEAIVMIFVGRLVADKGIHELIQAYRLIAGTNPNLWLLMVGPDEEGVTKSINFGENHDRIKRVPFTQEPETYLAAADFLCLPSHREGFGVVIIEAASMGLPAIASNIYGIKDAVIDGETGLLFEVGNVQALKICIETFIVDGHLRKTLGLNAYKYVKRNFDKNKIVTGYIDYIRNLMIN